MLGEKLIIFALDPKLDWATELRSKLSVIGSLFYSSLILVWNSNCTWKFLFWNYAPFSDPHS